MSATILAALITQIGVPELMRWLAELHAANQVVTEEAALAKLGLDADAGNALGQQFLDSHPPTP